MKMVPRIVLLVLSLFFLSALATGTSDMSILKNQFQSLIDELGSNSDIIPESNIASLLSRLDSLLKHNESIGYDATSLDWFKAAEPPSGPSPPTSHKRILIVISNFEGLYLHSGIGTFYAALSEFLASEGHSVTLLYTRMEDSETLLFRKWKESYEKKGMSIVRLGQSPIHIANSPAIQRSFEIFSYLRLHEQEFDVVQFPDLGGAAYYSLLAKHDGIAFLSKTFIIGLHGPWRWMNRLDADGGSMEIEDLEQDFMEQRSAELADVLWTPSVEIVDWLTQQGWALPPPSGKLFLMPLLPLAAESSRTTFASPHAIKELVFFGKLESRKGLELFCDALDKLATTRPDLAGLKVTFLGRIGNIRGMKAKDYLDQRAKNGWAFKVNIVSHKDRKGAKEYIRDPSRAVVIPSIIDNAPYTVYECLYSGVPFIASRIPSISAVILPEDREKTLFDLNALSLSHKVEELLAGTISPARMVMTLENATHLWQALYDSALTPLEQLPVAPATPLVSVCITHYNRPNFLEMAIKSVEAQTYKNLEVILVDDGSTNADAISYLDSLAPKFASNGWKIVRTANQYLGAARNTAAKNSNGEYLLFLDDDNYAKPEQVTTYVNVAARTGADALTSIHDVFQGKGTPSDLTHIQHRSIPLGASPAVGLFKNCFGDANFFIKKSVFSSLGGFTELRDVGQEDHEFLAKLVLAGHSLEVVPESLLYYRMHDQQDQMLYNTDPIKNQLRGTSPYISLMGEAPVLGALAQSRSKRAMAQCNMTITAISPQSIPIGTTPEITFTVTVLDCPISKVLIGSYQCTDVITHQGTGGGSSSFQCKSPSVVIAATYSVVVKFTTGTQYTASKQIIYTNGPNKGSTSAAAISVVSYSPPGGAKKRSPASCPFEDAFNQVACTVLSITCITSGPDSVLASCNQDPATNDYSLKISFFGLGDPTATALSSTFEEELNNPAWALIGITFLNFTVTGSCTASGCTCTPNFEGTDCSSLAACPNNCTDHGVCTDGVYTRVCDCYEGYTGRDCSISACPSGCSGNGNCVVAPGATSGTCVCDTNFQGNDCSVPTNGCPNSCSGHGTCSVSTCSCDAGWTGADCSSAGEDIITPPAAKGLSTSTTAFAVVVAIVGFLILVAIALGIVVAYRNRRRRQ